MRRAAGFAFVAAATISLVLAGFVGADCPGVDHKTISIDGWKLIEFYESSTTTPLTVKLSFPEIGADTEVQYYDGSWHGVDEGDTVLGSKTRFTPGGMLRIVYQYGECGGEIQPHDD